MKQNVRFPVLLFIEHLSLNHSFAAFIFQYGHKIDIIEYASGKYRLPENPFPPETALLKAAYRPMIECKDRKPYPVQSQFLESVIKHEFYDLFAEFLALVLRVAKKNAELGTAVQEVDLAEEGIADVDVAIISVNGKLEQTRCDGRLHRQHHLLLYLSVVGAGGSAKVEFRKFGVIEPSIANDCIFMLGEFQDDATAFNH
jgi:hypothetical protein